MAEVHALLYISGQPLCTDDVMERLKISRGNASMSLRALVDWGIVTRAHKRGDRKEYFQGEQDVWALLQSIVRERVKREIHPVMSALYEVRDLAGTPGGASAAGGGGAAGSAAGEQAANVARLDAMIQLLSTFDQLAERLVEAPREQLAAAAEALSGGE